MLAQINGDRVVQAARLDGPAGREVSPLVPEFGPSGVQADDMARDLAAEMLDGART
jgi:hypothetical protein